MNLRAAYRSQRDYARQRGIAWEFDSYEQWLAVWQRSGKLHLRGSGRGKYCMARKGDKGSYNPDNVLILSFMLNARGRVMSDEQKRKVGDLHRGKKLSQWHKQRISEVHGGEGNNHAKLTTRQVFEIRRDYRFRSPTTGGIALARKYGVSNSTISWIVTGQTWKSSTG